jgi:hypothetical protein
MNGLKQKVAVNTKHIYLIKIWNFYLKHFFIKIYTKSETKGELTYTYMK